jgi:phosphatidylserine decarboxylase
MMRRFQGVLLFQIILIALSVFVVTEFAINFPYPSPLVKPFLSPRMRWPAQQVIEWVENQNIDPAFRKFFYRDPERTVPHGPNLVAAADGVIQLVVHNDNITYLVIGLSFWDVHVVRTPIAGVVKSVETDGEYYAKYPTRAERDASFFIHGKAAPVQQIVTLQTDMGDVKVRLITSYWASRIKVWVHPGQSIAKGQRIGRILLGSTVVVELPGKIDFSLKPMQHVTAGETIICPDRPIK